MRRLRYFTVSEHKNAGFKADSVAVYLIANHDFGGILNLSTKGSYL